MTSVHDNVLTALLLTPLKALSLQFVMSEILLVSKNICRIVVRVKKHLQIKSMYLLQNRQTDRQAGRQAGSS